MTYSPYTPYPAPMPVAIPVPVIQRDPPRITSEEGPAPEKPRGLWPTRYAMVFGIVIIVLTVAAIALAAAAPSLAGNASSPIPAGWSKVYDDKPAPGQWSNPSGCDYSDNEVLITGRSDRENCAFLPSTRRDLTSKGVYVEVMIGPAAPLSGIEAGGILFGQHSNVIAAVVNQSGGYRLCSLPCSGGSIDVQGEATAWHTNGYTPNILGLRYLPDSQTVTMFINGQEVRSLDFTLGASSEITLGAVNGDQLPVTHVVIYSAGS